MNIKKVALLVLLALFLMASSGSHEYPLNPGGYVEVYCKDGTEPNYKLMHRRVVIWCD